MGGTKGTVYDNVLDHPVDLLFCADESMNLFLIPTKDIISAGIKSSLRLRTKSFPTSTNFKIDTSKYLVQI